MIYIILLFYFLLLVFLTLIPHTELPAPIILFFVKATMTMKMYLIYLKMYLHLLL